MNKLSYLGLPLAGLFACTLISGCDKADSPPSQAATPIIQAPPVEPMAIPVCLNDHCGVLDQDGKVLLGFENDFGNIIAADLKGHVLVAKDGLWSLVSADGKTVIKAQFTDGLRTLTPDSSALTAAASSV